MSAANAITRLLAPLANRIRMMVARAVVTLVNDAAKMQTLQLGLLADESKDGVEHFHPYGFTMHPHPGAEAVVIFANGNRDHGLVVTVGDRRHRITGLNEGDVALYSSGGNRVIMRASGDIEIYSPGDMLHQVDGVYRLEADGVEIHGRTYVQTDVAGKGERETWTGGTDWHTDSYTTGANTTADEHGLDAPHIPSDHPGAA